MELVARFPKYSKQFRITSERIRDKIAASKRKGLWVGGMVPMGYEVKNRKVLVIEDEAERVRTIFQCYLELGSLNLLMADLRQRRIQTKVRRLSSGRTVGGNPLTRGPLAQLLRNRFYIGEVVSKGDILPGEQPAIMDRKLFEASALSQGRTEQAGSVRRVPASEIGNLVIDAVRKRFKENTLTTDHDLINANVGRIEVHAAQIVIKLARKDDRTASRKSDNAVMFPGKRLR